MIAVVYSGSNYADWRLADRGRTVASFKTAGINPYFNDEKQIITLLNKNINRFVFNTRNRTKTY